MRIIAVGLLLVSALSAQKESLSREGRTIREGRVLKEAHFGEPCLLQVSKEVDPFDPETLEIVADMRATLARKGVMYAGLAAPQLYINKRVVLISSGLTKDRPGSVDSANEYYEVWLNASYEPVGEEMIVGLEMCVSGKGLVVEAPRYRYVSYSYQTLEGEWKEGLAEGYQAKVIQHECDHLDGIHVLMRNEDPRRIGFMGFDGHIPMDNSHKRVNQK